MQNIPKDPTRGAEKEAGYGKKLAEDLRRLRTGAIRKKLADRPKIARDILIYQLASSLFTSFAQYKDHQMPLALRGEITPLDNGIFNADDPLDRVNEGSNWIKLRMKQLLHKHGKWMGEYQSEEGGVGKQTQLLPPERWEIFQQIDEEEKEELLGFCVALMLNLQLSFDPKRSYEIEEIVEIVEPEYSNSMLTADLFWVNQTKKQILSLLEELGGEELSHYYRNLSKDALDSLMETIFCDDKLNGLIAQLDKTSRKNIREFRLKGF